MAGIVFKMASLDLAVESAVGIGVGKVIAYTTVSVSLQTRVSGAASDGDRNRQQEAGAVGRRAAEPARPDGCPGGATGRGACRPATLPRHVPKRSEAARKREAARMHARIRACTTHARTHARTHACTMHTHTTNVIWFKRI